MLDGELLLNVYWNIKWPGKKFRSRKDYVNAHLPKAKEKCLNVSVAVFKFPVFPVECSRKRRIYFIRDFIKATAVRKHEL